MRFSGWRHTNISDRLHGSSVWRPPWCVQGQTVKHERQWDLEDVVDLKRGHLCLYACVLCSDVLLTWSWGRVFCGRCLQVSQREPVKKSDGIKPVNFCTEPHVEGGWGRRLYVRRSGTITEGWVLHRQQVEGVASVHLSEPISQSAHFCLIQTLDPLPTPQNKIHHVFFYSVFNNLKS